MLKPINMGKKDIPITVSRRKLLKGLAALPLVFGMSSVTSAANQFKESGYLSDESKASLLDLKGTLPKGKVGKLEISRLVIGANQMVGASHSRDLAYVGQLFRKYNTDAKIFETFAMAEQAGINMVNVIPEKPPMFPSNLILLNKYKKSTGSKMQAMFQGGLGKDPDRLAPLKWAIDNDVTAIYIAGTTSDGLVKNGEIDVLAKAVDFVRGQGFPAGVGAHSIQVILACIKAGIKPDFYYKTVHHDKYWSANPREFRVEFETMTRSNDHNKINDNIWDIYPEQTVDVFKSIDVPWFGFKVLAGGAIPPKDGIRYAFENGADFVDLGMFDYQIVDNVNLAIEILGGLGNRERPWHG
jgi:hypothetical protein